MLLRTHGHFSVLGLPLALAGWIVCVIVLTRAAPAPAGHWLTAALIVAAHGALLLGGRYARLLYVANPGPWAAACAALWVAWLLAIPLAALTLAAPRSMARASAVHVLGGGAVAALLVARALVLPASPAPVIDVFSIGMEGADHVLAGRNPYGAAYTNVYGVPGELAPDYNYPPGTLLVQTAARWLLGDIRWAMLAADGVTVLALAHIAARLGGGAATGWWLAVLWLAFPAGPFAREQAWVDPLLVATLAVTAALLLDRRFLAAGLVLGYACAVKQYAIIPAALAVLAVAVAGERRGARRLAAAGASVAALLIAPFLLAGPVRFLAATSIPLRISIRTDAFTLTAWLIHCCDLRLPLLVQAAAGLGGVALAAVHLSRASGRAWVGVVRAWCAACLLAYGATFFAGKQAFLNYYELMLIFPVLCLALAAGAGDGQGVAGGSTPPATRAR